MNKINNSKLTGNAKTLRKNMTKEERHLWYDFLKDLPVTVHRQKVIGRYIVDFYIASSRLVIELDGSQHYEDENRKIDEERDEYLKTLGIRVLRYSNLILNKNFKGVCQDILNNIDMKADTSPPPTAEPLLKEKPSGRVPTAEPSRLPAQSAINDCRW